MKKIGRLPLHARTETPIHALPCRRNTIPSALERLIEFVRGLKNADSLEKHTLRPFLHRCTALRSDGSIADWHASLKAQHLSEFAVYFYLADGNGKLCGRLPLHVLFHYPQPEDLWAECDPDPVVVPVDTSATRVWRFMCRHRHGELPVCDERGKFLGVIYRAVLATHILKNISRNRPQNAKRERFSSVLNTALNSAKKESGL